MENLKIFKIKHKVTGLYSKGGCSVNDNFIQRKAGPSFFHWSKKGKIWQGMGPLKNHLRQYVRRSYPVDPVTGLYDYRKGTIANLIPEEWIVEEYDLGERITTEYPAKDLITV